MTSELFSRIASVALTPETSLRSTYGIARLLIDEDIPGDFVECGVYAGSHPAVMAHAVMEAGQAGRRKVHLFDSFRGIPMSGERDLDWHRGDPENRPIGPSGFAEFTSSGISACPRETVEENMRQWDVDPAVLVYHEGWFHLTLQHAIVGSIALLRLDADLHESTRVCLEYLYPKVVPGGWCICDDWVLDGCRDAVQPYLLLSESCPVYWRKS